MNRFFLVQRYRGKGQFVDGNQVGKSSGIPCPSPKGSRKNKFLILGVEVPGRQVAQKPEHMDIPSFRTTSGTDASMSKMVPYF
jgi:hypothetical protein